MKNQVEEAFTLCQLVNTILRGSEAKGQDPWSVSLRVSCPYGGKPIGIHHTHPGGEPVPSSQDISEARRLGLDFLCIGASKKSTTRCYSIRHLTSK